MMDGRIKTLHPKVHGGLLAVRENPEHEAAMLAHDIQPIDLLVVNLYPFEETLAKKASFEECVENIDIGGPAMIRGAAKIIRMLQLLSILAIINALLKNCKKQAVRLGSRLAASWRRKHMRELPPMTPLFLIGWRSKSMRSNPRKSFWRPFGASDTLWRKSASESRFLSYD